MRLHYQVSAHPNIVSLLRIMDTPQDTYVIMEFCPEGDLFLNITERGRYVGDDGAARQVFLQILDAVSHCHRLGIYHRDLKPENILVADDGRQVKLTDFGLATTEPYATEFGCGSTFYMSPECQDQHSGKAFYACAPNDVWSLGVILVNLTCGRNPWKSASARDSTFRAFMEDRNFLKTILPLSDELNEILGMIFELDPARRIKLDELRRRIIQCRHFTNPPPPVYSSPTCYQEPLSPASSISDEGSMMSDHSDNSYASTDPSEVGSTVDCGLTTEILDDEFVPEVFTFHAADDVKLPPSDHWSPGVHVDEASEAPQHLYVETHVPHPSRADPFVSRISNPSDVVHAPQLIEVSPQRMNIPVHKGSEYPPFRSPSVSPQSYRVWMNFANISMPRVPPQGPPKRSYRRRSFLGNPWPRPVCPRINPHFVFPVHA
jgi:serine/threonine protein kinase